MQSEHIVLDTNLWLSFLISRNYSQLDGILKSGKYRLAFSRELIDEFIEVANRPKFKKYFKKSDVLHLVESIQEYADFFEVTTRIDLCRDAKDNFLLSLSVESMARYLITGDKDVLAIKKVNVTKIISYSDFLKKERIEPLFV